MEVQLPCGRCIGCRLEYARQWAVRIMHEASLHEENSFTTLTYRDSCLPFNNSLVKSHLQDFWKRLRYHSGQRFRYYVAGEYSDDGRPHYHACIFGFFPSDAKLYNINNGYRLYESEMLDEVWGHGLTMTGSVTFESAGYCARYITKKINGKQAEEVDPQTGLKHYERVTNDGEIVEITHEFASMSLRPGIGADWIDRYADETWRDDSVVVNGTEVLPPRFYLSRLPDRESEVIKARRRRAAEAQKENATLERLRVRQTVKESQLRMLKR